MNRRKMLRAVAVSAASVTALRTAVAQSPDNPTRPAALQRTGRPSLSSFEAVKAVSDGKSKDILPEVAEYYQHYGANFASRGEWSKEQAASYTRFIQRSLRHRETGILTADEASYILSRKRCGRPDPTPAQAASAALRFRYTNPTWFIDPAMKTNLTVEQWRNVLAKAWAAWQAVSVLTPKPSSNAPAANCLHASGLGRTDGFDGPSGVLAWAELPPVTQFTGQLLNRFDAAELWTAEMDERSIRALNVATHEIGHLLGLEHSSDPSALMAPFYDPDVPAPVADDIRRIRALYPTANLNPAVPEGPGVPPAPPVPPVNPPAPPSDPPSAPDCPTGRRPRWFPALPRLFPRRRGVC